MNKNFTFALTASLSLFTSLSFAGTLGPDPSSWVAALSAGPAWQNAGETQTFLLTPEIEKSYVADKTSEALFQGELFVGRQNAIPYNLQSQLGVALVATSNASPSGIIWDDADPLFANYLYNYKIQHTHVAVKGKLLADNGYWFIPWLSASLGVGFNQSYVFNDTPRIFQAIPNPHFTSHTNTAFTYTVGAGFQKVLTTHWQAGVGYEFSDWGSSNLGLAAEQTLNGGPRINHVYTNGLMFNVTYIA